MQAVEQTMTVYKDVIEDLNEFRTTTTNIMEVITTNTKSFYIDGEWAIPSFG